MPSVSPQHVTQLLADWSHGDDAALAELTPLVYEEAVMLIEKSFPRGTTKVLLAIIASPAHAKVGRNGHKPFARFRARAREDNDDDFIAWWIRFQNFGGKIAAGHCGCFFMNSARQERNSFAGSSAEGIELDKNSTSVHPPWELRITPLYDSVLFVLSFSDMGVAEIQAQSPFLRICTSVKTTFPCHACESCCIGLVARSPSRMARRKGDPLSGDST